MEKTSRKHIKTKASKSCSMRLSVIIFAVTLSILLVTTQSVVYGSPMAQLFQDTLDTNYTEQAAGLSSGGTDTNDIVVLSHRFDESSFSSEIIGEVMNNGTRSYDMYDIDIYANLRDSTGSLLVSEQGFIDAQSLRPGSSSAFNVFFLDEEIPENTVTYDLIINDERLVSAQPLEESFSISSEIGVAGNSNDNDNDDNSNSNLDLPECDENERVNPSTGECEGFSCIPEDTDCDGDMDPPFVDPDEEPKEDEENDNNDGDDSDEEDESDNGEEGGGE